MPPIQAKPFLKWAGGKTQLLPTIDSFLPRDFAVEKDVTYIEPFIGGGAMLFHMLAKYPNIKRAVINDINSRLIGVYKVVRDNPRDLIDVLKSLDSSFKALRHHEDRKEFYNAARQRFNEGSLSMTEESALMIFLNRTCFNGLYRENSKGYFNVPFGRYANPTICDEELLMADSELLQRVEILNGDFSQTEDCVHGYTIFYFDPPYRPLGGTSSFNSYVKEPFDDNEQERLAAFFARMSHAGHHALLSNSDCMGRDGNDDFLDNLYIEFIIERVTARRSINSNASKRGQLTEMLIRNYLDCQG